jgi:amino acid transporter
MAKKPHVLDYRTPARKLSSLLQAERILVGGVAGFVALLALFCIVGGLYQGADWIWGLILGLFLLFIAALLWKAPGRTPRCR